MQKSAFTKWLLLLCLGLSFNSPQSAQAAETVSYTPGSPFTLNPITGNPNQSFGSVNVQSDDSSGWTLQVRSLHRGALKHTSSAYTVQYSLTVDGTLVDLSGNEATAKTVITATCYESDGCHYPLQGTINAAEINGKPAGSYTDTLTFILMNQ